MHNNQMIIIFAMSNNKSNNMSNEQIKKDLLIQRAFLKKELDQLRFISEVTGTNQEKEIDKRLDRILTNLSRVRKKEVKTSHPTGMA